MLLVDEATSHLDVELESLVNNSIASLGMTRIVIAHRKETIAAGQRIYRLSNGALTPVEPIQAEPIVDRPAPPVRQAS